MSTTIPSAAFRSNGPNPCSYFLCLPVEIRLTIHEYALGVSTLTQVEISVCADKYASADTGRLVLQCSKSQAFPVEPAILRTNRLIYREALPLLYNRCKFFPSADEHVIATFFGQMSNYARSRIATLHLRPRPQKIVRMVGPRAVLSQVAKGPSWAPTCANLSVQLISLEELFIHLHPMYGLALESRGDIDWIIRPLSRIRGVRKTLVSVGSGSQNIMTLGHVGNWNELMENAEDEAEEYAACGDRIMKDRGSWPDPYWIAKRHRLPESGRPTAQNRSK